MTPPDRPKRPGTERDRRRTPSSGVAVGVVAEEPTPPPGPMPAIDDDMKEALAAIKNKIDEHTGAIEKVWDARHLSKRMDIIEQDLKENTKATIRSEALIEGLFAPLVTEHTAKLDTCLHYIAASSHVATSVDALGRKIDALGQSLNGIEKEQVSAAEKFEAHDLRDKEIETVVHRIDTRVTALEQRKAVDDSMAKKATEDATAKQLKLVAKEKWWKSSVGKGLAALLLATAGLITALAAYLS